MSSCVILECQSEDCGVCAADDSCWSFCLAEFKCFLEQFFGSSFQQGKGHSDMLSSGLEGFITYDVFPFHAPV